MDRALQDIAAERRRQPGLGFDAAHDDRHGDGALASAAACYAANSVGHQGRGGTQSVPDRWPWHRAWWKPRDPRRDLVKAGALIVAEIERLDRVAAAPQKRRRA